MQETRKACCNATSADRIEKGDSNAARQCINTEVMEIEKVVLITARRPDPSPDECRGKLFVIEVVLLIEEKLNLYERLAQLRKRVEFMQEDASGYGYKYVSEESLLAKITGLMEELHLSLVPRVLPGTMKVEKVELKKKKYMKEVGLYDDVSNEYLVQADMEYTWVNNDNPEETIVIPWVFVGSQSDPSQAMGSGLTYANRYFLMKMFQVASSEDDPDNWRSKQRAAEAEEEKLIADKIIEEIDKAIHIYLDANPKGGEAVKNIVTKFRKDGDYFKIKESIVASKLLDEIKKELLKEDR